ncbi:MAG TPA: peptidoglycan DD-metalloendopeptidase family protein [Candidatus Dormibacteraeota bacterium]|nr:peptidoglycan DD-metalloendopeptidase family protein [Candidatus Dormibacteraeota bacterium]
MKSRIIAAAVIASLAAIPGSSQVANAIYCYPGDPPDVYQACLAYNAGINQQVSNQQQLQNIYYKIQDVQKQINALYALIANLNNQIAAQEALIAQTKARILDLDRQIRFKQAELTRLQADVAVRDQLLDQRLRYVDGHGPINYVELVLTSSSFNELLNRMMGAQQVAASDRKLLDVLAIEHTQVTSAQADLAVQRSQVQALLLQQQAEEADLEKNKVTQQQAMAYAAQLEYQLQVQYSQLMAQRAAIDAQVAALARQYDAAAAKAGGGSGVFEWPEPACNFSCITQGFGCSTFYLEIYDAACPYPHRIHTGIDIAGPWGTPIVAADTGVVYLYPNSIGYGNMVLMIHGNGYSTVYGHTDHYAPGLRSGMIVARGTTIAFEGSTGWSTGPHLHFEVRVNNAYQDPCIWLGC